MHATAAETNLAAECRAVEEGHLCRLDRAEHCFVVRSDSTAATYRLHPRGVDGYVVCDCDCPAGRRAHERMGVTACKHQALVCRRLEREGLVYFDGALWRTEAPAAGPHSSNRSERSKS